MNNLLGRREAYLTQWEAGGVACLRPRLYTGANGKEGSAPRTCCSEDPEAGLASQLPALIVAHSVWALGAGVPGLSEGRGQRGKLGILDFSFPGPRPSTKFEP